MSQLPRIVEDNQTMIIAAGLVVGAMSVFGYLPNTTEFLNLGVRVKYAYFGIIAFSIWLLFRKAQGRTIPRTVVSRDLSNPAYRRNLGMQYSRGGSMGGVRYPQTGPPRRDVPPSVADQFRRER